MKWKTNNLKKWGDYKLLHARNINNNNDDELVVDEESMIKLLRLIGLVIGWLLLQ